MRRTRYRIAQKAAPFPPLRWASIDVEQFRQPRNFLKAESFRLRDPKNYELVLLSGPLKTREVLLLQLPQIAKLKPLKEAANCQLFIPLSTLPDADCLRFLEEIPKVSENLFEPLGRARADGKRYVQTKVAQEMFPFEPPERAATATAYKRSYTETKREDGGLSRQPMSIWDLLLPLLQPSPFDLASGQVVFLPCDLQPHQPEGVKFLATNSAALLGDGVQTGKTIQAVVAMKLLFQSAKIKSALVVCPISVLMHWQKQLEKWAPELWQGLTVVRSPSKEHRRNMWRMPARVYITNYETVVNDFDEILELRCGCSWLRRGFNQPADTFSQANSECFDLIVADEIQRIKNAKTAASKNMKTLGKRAALPVGSFRNTCRERLG